MQIPRDVILDLLPIYLSGEATEVTRLFVEEQLRADPELAARVRAAAALRIDPDMTELPPDLEMRALRVTRRELSVARWLFGLACFFSALCFGVQIDLVDGSTRVTMLVLRYPAIMVYPAALALACWVTYFIIRRARLP